MDTKSQFLSNRELASWWGGISTDSRFDQVLLHAAGCALEGSPSEQERAGVLKFKEILLTLSDAGAPDVKFTNPGLNHSLDTARRTVNPPAPKQPEQPKKKL